MIFWLVMSGMLALSTAICIWQWYTRSMEPEDDRRQRVLDDLEPLTEDFWTRRVASREEGLR